QAIRPQRLQQVARALYQEVGAVLGLEHLQRCDDVVAQQPAVLPGELGLGARRDIFRDPVEEGGDRVVWIGDVGPVRREDLVGLAAEQQVERAAKDLAHGAAERRVEVRRGPAAEREAAGRVLLRATGRLHDAVEAGEGGDDDSAHVGLARIWFRWPKDVTGGLVP